MDLDGKRVIKTVAPRWLIALVMTTALAGCSVVTERDALESSEPASSLQQAPSTDSVAVEALQVALAQRGIRYRSGGDEPGTGFDCSGLVFFSFSSVGISLPRTSQDMYRHARRIEKSELRPGDLVFFRLRSSRISHVGIYAGDGRFVHAPSRGKDVELAALDDAYWKKRFAGAGRIDAEASTLASF
ncbi:MAG TPA: NlpC/P60 family protein [Chromatiales bacterium]|nr:NlpC/P60 family protein [Chromatiales bacterium]